MCICSAFSFEPLTELALDHWWGILLVNISKPQIKIKKCFFGKKKFIKQRTEQLDTYGIKIEFLINDNKIMLFNSLC